MARGRKPAEGLTKRNRQVLQAIGKLSRKLGHSPTFAEIGAEIGVKSTCAVSRHIDRLCEMGYLTHQPNQVRTLRVLHSE